MIALGSLGIPLKSVMSAVGQQVCAAGQGEKMGEELMVCPCLMLLSVFITAFGSLHFFLSFFFEEIYYFVFPSYAFTFHSLATLLLCAIFSSANLEKRKLCIH